MLVSVAQAAEAAGEAAKVGFFSDPETWIAITWLIVVGLLFRPVARGITGALDKRRDRISQRIEDAERLRAEAQEMLAAYQKKQREALKEAQAIIAQAKAEAERLAAEASKELDETLKRRERQALDRISQAEADALREVRNTAIDIAVAAARRLLAENLPAEKAAELIDAAIKDLPTKFH
jgi:F-type H+-transporting ATPase subunit b